MLQREDELAQLFKDAGCFNNRNLVDPEKGDQAQNIFRDFLDEYLVSVGIVKKPKLVGANKNRDKVVSRIEFTINGERTRAHLGSYDTAQLIQLKYNHFIKLLRQLLEVVFTL